MKNLFLILILFFTPNAFAQAGFSHENSITGGELNNLKNELTVVEKNNNEKYKDISSSEKLIQFYSSLSQLFGRILGKSNNSFLNETTANNNIKPYTPEVLSDGSEIYSQKIFFRYTAYQHRLEQAKLARARRAAMLRKKKTNTNLENNFATSLDYNL